MKSAGRPLILISNDDGIDAKGLASLVAVAKGFGEVVVIAPDKPQSGMGHAITIHDPLRLFESKIHAPALAYACSGTPVDCVKLGIYEVLKRKPDLILSGVNHGENSSTNVLYSGTMSAAMEGAMEGIPSIGFSLSNFAPDADFGPTQFYIDQILQLFFKNGLPANCCLNVNIPDIPLADIKGIKIAKQAHAYWADRFEKRQDQYGRTYFWLSGEFADLDQRPDTDLHALKAGYVSVVPTHFDLTAYTHIQTLKSWENETKSE
jgi:5'-nucleotidase